MPKGRPVRKARAKVTAKAKGRGRAGGFAKRVAAKQPKRRPAAAKSTGTDAASSNSDTSSNSSSSKDAAAKLKVKTWDGPSISKPKDFYNWHPTPFKLKKVAFGKQLKKHGMNPDDVKDRFNEFFTPGELSQLMVETKREGEANAKTSEIIEKLKKDKGRNKASREILANRLCCPDDWKQNILSIYQEAKLEYGDKEEEEKLSRGELEQRCGPAEAAVNIQKGKWVRESDSDGDSVYVKTKKTKMINKTKEFRAGIQRSKFTDNELRDRHHIQSQEN